LGNEGVRKRLKSRKALTVDPLVDPPFTNRGAATNIPVAATGSPHVGMGSKGCTAGPMLKGLASHWN
jgi:hypothetical protein